MKDFNTSNASAVAAKMFAGLKGDSLYELMANTSNLQQMLRNYKGSLDADALVSAFGLTVQNDYSQLLDALAYRQSQLREFFNEINGAQIPTFTPALNAVSERLNKKAKNAEKFDTAMKSAYGPKIQALNDIFVKNEDVLNRLDSQIASVGWEHAAKKVIETAIRINDSVDEAVDGLANVDLPVDDFLNLAEGEAHNARRRRKRADFGKVNVEAGASEVAEDIANAFLTLGNKSASMCALIAHNFARMSADVPTTGGSMTVGGKQDTATPTDAGLKRVDVAKDFCKEFMKNLGDAAHTIEKLNADNTPKVVNYFAQPGNQKLYDVLAEVSIQNKIFLKHLAGLSPSTESASIRQKYLSILGLAVAELEKQTSGPATEIKSYLNACSESYHKMSDAIKKAQSKMDAIFIKLASNELEKVKASDRDLEGEFQKFTYDGNEHVLYKEALKKLRGRFMRAPMQRADIVNIERLLDNSKNGLAVMTESVEKVLKDKRTLYENMIINHPNVQKDEFKQVIEFKLTNLEFFFKTCIKLDQALLELYKQLSTTGELPVNLKAYLANDTFADKRAKTFEAKLEEYIEKAVDKLYGVGGYLIRGVTPKDFLGEVQHNLNMYLSTNTKLKSLFQLFQKVEKLKDFDIEEFYEAIVRFIVASTIEVTVDGDMSTMMITGGGKKSRRRVGGYKMDDASRDKLDIYLYSRRDLAEHVAKYVDTMWPQSAAAQEITAQACKEAQAIVDKVSKSIGIPEQKCDIKCDTSLANNSMMETARETVKAFAPAMIPDAFHDDMFKRIDEYFDKDNTVLAAVHESMKNQQRKDGLYFDAERERIHAQLVSSLPKVVVPDIIQHLSKNSYQLNPVDKTRISFIINQVFGELANTEWPGMEEAIKTMVQNAKSPTSSSKLQEVLCAIASTISDAFKQQVTGFYTRLINYSVIITINKFLAEYTANDSNEYSIDTVMTPEELNVMPEIKSVLERQENIAANLEGADWYIQAKDEPEKLLWQNNYESLVMPVYKNIRNEFANKLSSTDASTGTIATDTDYVADKIKPNTVVPASNDSSANGSANPVSTSTKRLPVTPISKFGYWTPKAKEYQDADGPIKVGGAKPKLPQLELVVRQFRHDNILPEDMLFTYAMQAIAGVLMLRLDMHRAVNDKKAIHKAGIEHLITGGSIGDPVANNVSMETIPEASKLYAMLPLAAIHYNKYLQWANAPNAPYYNQSEQLNLRLIPGSRFKELVELMLTMPAAAQGDVWKNLTDTEVMKIVGTVNSIWNAFASEIPSVEKRALAVFETFRKEVNDSIKFQTILDKEKHALEEQEEKYNKYAPMLAIEAEKDFANVKPITIEVIQNKLLRARYDQLLRLTNSIYETIDSSNMTEDKLVNDFTAFVDAIETSVTAAPANERFKTLTDILRNTSPLSNEYEMYNMAFNEFFVLPITAILSIYERVYASLDMFDKLLAANVMTPNEVATQLLGLQIPNTNYIKVVIANNVVSLDASNMSAKLKDNFDKIRQSMELFARFSDRDTLDNIMQEMIDLPRNLSIDALCNTINQRLRNVAVANMQMIVRDYRNVNNTVTLPAIFNASGTAKNKPVDLPSTGELVGTHGSHAGRYLQALHDLANELQIVGGSPVLMYELANEVVNDPHLRKYFEVKSVNVGTGGGNGIQTGPYTVNMLVNATYTAKQINNIQLAMNAQFGIDEVAVGNAAILYGNNFFLDTCLTPFLRSTNKDIAKYMDQMAQTDVYKYIGALPNHIAVFKGLYDVFKAARDLGLPQVDSTGAAYPQNLIDELITTTNAFVAIFERIYKQMLTKYGLPRHMELVKGEFDKHISATGDVNMVKMNTPLMSISTLMAVSHANGVVEKLGYYGPNANEPNAFKPAQLAWLGANYDASYGSAPVDRFPWTKTLVNKVKSVINPIINDTHPILLKNLMELMALRNLIELRTDRMTQMPLPANGMTYENKIRYHALNGNGARRPITYVMVGSKYELHIGNQTYSASLGNFCPEFGGKKYTDWNIATIDSLKVGALFNFDLNKYARYVVTGKNDPQANKNANLTAGMFLALGKNPVSLSLNLSLVPFANLYNFAQMFHTYIRLHSQMKLEHVDEFKTISNDLWTRMRPNGYPYNVDPMLSDPLKLAPAYWSPLLTMNNNKHLRARQSVQAGDGQYVQGYTPFAYLGGALYQYSKLHMSDGNFYDAYLHTETMLGGFYHALARRNQAIYYTIPGNQAAPVPVQANAVTKDTEFNRHTVLKTRGLPFIYPMMWVMERYYHIIRDELYVRSRELEHKESDSTMKLKPALDEVFEK